MSEINELKELTETVYVPEEKLAEIEDYLENGGLEEYRIISVTAHFPDGKFVDIMVCSDDEAEPAWAQAVLFNEDGNQMGWSESEDSFDGEWFFWTKDTQYTVVVDVSASDSGQTVCEEV